MNNIVLGEDFFSGVASENGELIQQKNKFEDIMVWYRCAIREVRTKLEVLNDEYQNNHDRNPIDNIKARIKTPMSIYEKLIRRDFPVTLDSILFKMHDVAGIRVICPFLDDIYTVADALIAQDDIHLIQLKDYIKEPKPNGYRSLHLVVEVPIFLSTGKKLMKVEVQIRTIAMNFWATIEHSLKYKYRHNIPEEIKDKLTEAAQAVVKLDKEMSAVRDEITDAQNLFQQKANLVAEILNTIENLYSLANKREIIKIQDEFYMIYKQDDIDKLRKFSRELDFIAEGYRAQGI